MKQTGQNAHTEKAGQTGGRTFRRDNGLREHRKISGPPVSARLTFASGGKITDRLGFREAVSGWEIGRR